MDLTTASGFLLACVCMLHCKQDDFMALLAIKCSSFSKMNRGTSKRCDCAALGFDAYPSVREANQLLERCFAVPGGWGITIRRHPNVIIAGPMPVVATATRKRKQDGTVSYQGTAELRETASGVNVPILMQSSVLSDTFSRETMSDPELEASIREEDSRESHQLASMAASKDACGTVALQETDLDDDAMRSKLQESCGSLDGEPGDHVAPPNIRPVATPARANRDVGPEKGTGKLQQGKYKKPLTRQEMSDLFRDMNFNKPLQAQFGAQIIIIVTRKSKIKILVDQGWYSEMEMKTDLKWSAPGPYTTCIFQNTSINRRTLPTPLHYIL
ncbi:unnamed protein product [Symbiodinium pilosum]|uniref:Uncharacterized protein n=1 Tax=Symbiodinium pilosum TaxID=2952 RepID=A0A812Q521_SYMPI|nr:unnamed protein product [Symbiodinium pilosum]